LNHLLISDSQNLQPVIQHGQIAAAIPLHRSDLLMDFPIEFQHQRCFGAKEVSDVLSDGMLPTELVAPKPSVAQFMPQDVLGAGNPLP
jgi:hypothetical protein